MSSAGKMAPASSVASKLTLDDMEAKENKLLEKVWGGARGI